MMTTRTRFFLLSSLVAALFVTAASSARAADESGFHLLQFRGAQASYFQDDGNCFTGILTWNPSLISGAFGLRASLGATYLRRFTGDRKMALEYALLAAYRMTPDFELEAGGGFQNWIDNGGSQPMIGANAVFPFRISLVDRIVAGYSLLFVQSYTTHMIRIGAGFSF